MLSNIAITQPNLNVYSETFIRNHIEHLGKRTKVHNLAGGWIPNHANDKPLVPGWMIFLEKVWAKLTGHPFVYGYTAKQVQRYLKENDIEMVLCECGPGGVAMMPICKRLGIPFAVHFFGIDLHGVKSIKQYGDAYKKVFKEADLIIGISTLQCKILSEMGLDKAKLRHIVCGADLMYSPQDIAKIDKQTVFVAAGRMVEKKAPLLTIRAFHEASMNYPDAKLVYVGDGPLMPDCKKYVSEHQLQQKIEFVGPRSPKQLAQLYAESLCFVQHSVTASDGDSEGTPVAILEAGLAGIPVIATRHAGIMDTVIDGETGFLVPEHDVASMAQRMEQMLMNPGLSTEMGNRAHAHILKNFSLPVTIQQLWDALNEAYDKRKNKK
jgi:colanic acid/amylovoran biosynthesis glycosyltransferase